MPYRQQMIQFYVFLCCCLQPSAQILTKQDVVTQPQMNEPNDFVSFSTIIKKLNKTLTSLDPLSVWLVKDRYSTLEALQINLVKMRSCIHNQANLRLELTLLKVLKGEEVNVVVYGGSNCAQGMFPVILNDWWTKVITPISGSRVNVKTVGIGGTGSYYYQFCHEIYLEENETIDLVILETAVNDVLSVVLGTSGYNLSLPLEHLSRQLLKRSNNPAVFYVNFFIVEGNKCLNLVDYGQSLISDLYEITTISLRCLCCRYLKGKSYTTSKTDDVQDSEWHSNILGHAQIAFMLIHVISKTFLKMAQDMKRLAANDLPTSWFEAINSKIPPIPSPVYIKGEGKNTRSPKCWTTNLTSNYKKNTIHNTLDVSVVKRFGFKYINQITIGGPSYSAKNIPRTDAYGCYFGDKIGSEVTFSFEISLSTTQRDAEMNVDKTGIPQRSENSVGATGSVGIICRSGANSGVVAAWLDGNPSTGVRISPRRDRSQTTVAIIATKVKPGIHTLTLRIVEELNFVLVGVFVGPSEWP